MMLGAGVSLWARDGLSKDERRIPELWRSTIGAGPVKRYAAAFLRGFIVLNGARLAGECTSGHMMSGMMQTALSGYIFSAGAFAAAVPVALYMYREA